MQENDTMRKFFIWILLAALVVSAAPVLAQDADMEAWTCPEGYEGQTLSIFNWSTYIAEDTIPNFEDACGVTVEYSIFESTEEALAVLREGNPGYDIVVPSDFTVAIMAGEGLLQEIDYSFIPNAEYIDPAFRNTSYDPDDLYSIPYQWGTIGIGYNTEAFPDGITSWEDLFTHDGPVSWIQEARSTISISANILGYDPNTTDEDELEEAAEYLIENGSNVITIAGDDGQALLAAGEVDAAVEYSGDVYQVMYDCEGADCEGLFAYVIPSEGTVVWSDNMVVPADAPNAELAFVFMDYLLDPQVSADLANYIAYGSPNRASIENGLIDAVLLEDPGIYPDEETYARLFEVKDLPEVEEVINDLWEEISLSVGN
jgi:spermidine/putrescine transport system substrate-binding protein